MARDDHQPPESPESPDPPNLPGSPDPRRVSDLRARMLHDRSGRDAEEGARKRRLSDQKRRRARDLGAYTLIPMLMLAGPAVGYGLGLLVQRRWGGEPWPVAIGVLVGMVAGFRQVFLLLAGIQKRDRNGDR